MAFTMHVILMLYLITQCIYLMLNERCVGIFYVFPLFLFYCDNEGLRYTFLSLIKRFMRINNITNVQNKKVVTVHNKY